MTCVCCVSVVSVLVTLQTYGPVSVTLTLWMVRTLTASVAWDRASRWGLVSTQLFVCWEETDTLKTSCFFVAKTLFFYCYVPLCQGRTTECPPRRWTPPERYSSGWECPPPTAPPGPQETAWHHKPDFLFRGEDKTGVRGGTEGRREGDRKKGRSDIVSGFSFLTRAEEITRGAIP